MQVAVFGASAPRPGEPAYETAYRLGQALARAGHVVLNGGYIGTMEAVSRGAAEAGGRVIGVTCAAIERWRPVGPNPWLSEVWPTQTLCERLQRLLTAADAAVVLPGSVGTWTEMLLWWNHVHIGALPPKPWLLYGPEWRAVWEAIFTHMAAYFGPQHRQALHFVDDPQQVVEVLAAWRAAPAAAQPTRTQEEQEP